MENSRFGCLTRSGIIFAIATTVVLAVVFIWQGAVFFSPGPLNAQAGKNVGGVTSHAQIGSHCETCHAPFWSSTGMSTRCLKCHTDVAAELTQPTTFHGALLVNGGSDACWNCHPDHLGATASLIKVDPAHFSHDNLGNPPFSLTGAHVALACTRCHANNVFTGAPTDCVSCHPEPADHTNQSFSTDCTQCHTTINWNANFNHPDACGRGSCLSHHGATCADCHPVDDSTATCTKCHRNNPLGGGG